MNLELEHETQPREVPDIDLGIETCLDPDKDLVLQLDPDLEVENPHVQDLKRKLDLDEEKDLD